MLFFQFLCLTLSSGVSNETGLFAYRCMAAKSDRIYPKKTGHTQPWSGCYLTEIVLRV